MRTVGAGARIAVLATAWGAAGCGSSGNAPGDGARAIDAALADAPTIDAPSDRDAAASTDARSTDAPAVTDALTDAAAIDARPDAAGPPTLNPDLVVQIYQTQLASGSTNCWQPTNFDLGNQGSGSSAPPPTSPAWNGSGSHPARGSVLLTRTLLRESGGWSTGLPDVPTYTLVDPDGTGATIDDNGTITTGAPGIIHVIAHLDNTFSDPALATVRVVDTDAPSAIRINPANDGSDGSPAFGVDPVFVPIGANSPVTVTATYPAAIVGAYCVTYDTAYASSNPAIAFAFAGFVSAGSGSATGSATVTATVGAQSDTITVTVIPPQPEYIVITPDTATIAAGSSASLRAFEGFTDSSLTEVTTGSATTWSIRQGPFAISGSGVATRAGANANDTGEAEVCFQTAITDAHGVAHAQQTMCSDSIDNSPFAPIYLSPQFPINLDALLTAQ